MATAAAGDRTYNGLQIMKITFFYTEKKQPVKGKGKGHKEKCFREDEVQGH